ncbi:clarin-1 [Rhinichthys klamathensis goyatoka]|uniref:clarin-1 n=1 Tax=Rhinichthys klamathensis goyatoka TaxID=3034132 RepID=UPI0024B5DEFE|nr:clarin-1 [Rhinichthys klamathensis goyatoka]
MPSRQKKIIFSIAGVLCFGCVLVVAAAMGTQFWVQAAVLCQTGAQIVNASGAELEKFIGSATYGLFHGKGMKQCGLGDRRFYFSFFPDLMDVVPASLHVSVIFFCAVLIVFSSVSCGFFFYNAFGSPYETLHGPQGLYLWNMITCFCGCLVLILFSSEVKLHHLTEIIFNFNEVSFVYKTQSERYDRSFWLIFLAFLTHGLNILLIRLAGIQFPFQEAKESDVSTGAADLMY